MKKRPLVDGARILVTGGAGFVGSHIVDALLDEGAEQIVVIDNMVRGNVGNLAVAMQSGRVDLVEGDIRDRGLMDRLVAGTDIVFHQAALRITHCAAEPDEAMSVMVDATYHLLQDCLRHGVGKVVMASSASVYGMAPHLPTPETDNPYNNRTLYGAAKCFGEGMLRAFNDMYGLRYVALRYFNVYGPRMDLHGKYTEVMVRWMERIAAGEPPIVFGDGTQTMDLVHVRDVARANVLAARAEASDNVYNVGSGTETSLLELAQLLARGLGKGGLVPEHAAERKVNPVPRRLADTTAAARDLGFRAEIGPEEGMADLIAWWVENRHALRARHVAE